MNPPTASLAPLDARDVYRFFHTGLDETLALRGVSLQLRAGELVAVTGPSGSGKSTLLACLAGLDEPDGGMVSIAGQRMSRTTEPERAAQRATGIGIMFQHGNLIDSLTVRDNIFAVQRLVGRPDRTAADALLAALGLAHRGDAWPITLSGGEAARAGLAVALANHPAVVLCDEPTGELDGDTASHIVALLRGVAGEGRAVVIVTHNPDIAAAADREVRLRDGRIVMDESPT